MNSADVCEPRKSDSGRGGKRYLALGSKSLTPGEGKEIVLAARRHERSRSTAQARFDPELHGEKGVRERRMVSPALDRGRSWAS
jgi:hypothetical protein